MGFAQVAPVKGLEGFNRSSPVTGPTYVDATIGGKRLRRGARLSSVATSTFKAETYRFLRQDRPTPEEIIAGASFPPGAVPLPTWTDGEWLKQMTAEPLVTVKSRRGFTKLEWQKMRERNEALDCRVYAASGLEAFLKDRSIIFVDSITDLTRQAMAQSRFSPFFNAWPEYFHSFADQVGQEARMRKPLPSPRMITDADAAMLWLRWVDKDIAQILWARANRKAWKGICWEHGISRAAANRRHEYGLAVIVWRLNGKTPPRMRSMQYVINHSC